MARADLFRIVNVTCPAGTCSSFGSHPVSVTVTCTAAESARAPGPTSKAARVGTTSVSRMCLSTVLNATLGQPGLFETAARKRPKKARVPAEHTRRTK